jgi:hypothetical protein
MKLTWADKKFGRICKKCGKRHVSISTRGENLPKDYNRCKEK